jgi:hypothetical protein
MKNLLDKIKNLFAILVESIQEAQMRRAELYIKSKKIDV